MSNLNQFANGSLLKYNTSYRLSASSGAVVSNAFQSDTVAIMIRGTGGGEDSSADMEMFAFEIGANPDADTTRAIGPSRHDAPITIGVNGGDKIAVCNAFDGGQVRVSVIELKY